MTAVDLTKKGGPEVLETLSYVTAYQMIHRVALVSRGQTVLVGGHVVMYGFMGTNHSFAAIMRNFFDLYVGAFCVGRRAKFYGITADYRKDPTSFQHDLPKLLALLGERKLHPRIAARLPLFAAREANERLERGGIAGKLVLVADVESNTTASLATPSQTG